MAESRRDFFRLGFGLTAGWLAAPATALAKAVSGRAAGPPVPVTIPDTPKLPRGGALERAEQAYAEALQRYQQMTGSYSQVLVARRTLFQMEDAALDSQQSSWAATLDIQAKLPFQLPRKPAPVAPGAKPGGRD